MGEEIRFNWPYTTGDEFVYISEAIRNRVLSGNGPFTKRCQDFFSERYKFRKTFLTTSCTDALEMCAMLADIQDGDEVIVPSFTFVSTALAFVRQGAKIVFVDSRKDHPGMDEDQIESLITKRTKAIVPVHYAGVACDMDKIMALAEKYNLLVIEDAAQAIDSYYKNKPLGGIGHMAAFSFHETKNIHSGEGGLLVINDQRFVKRAEIIWEKGTDRARFFRGEIDKYSWVDIGSSFLPSEIVAAFLWAQLERIDMIQQERKLIWDKYHAKLSCVSNCRKYRVATIPSFATNNAHMFYILCRSIEERSDLISRLKDDNIKAVFHYHSLHKSEYYRKQYLGGELINSDIYANCLLRLPLYIRLDDDSQNRIVEIIKDWDNH